MYVWITLEFMETDEDRYRNDMHLFMDTGLEKGSSTFRSLRQRRDLQPLEYLGGFDGSHGGGGGRSSMEVMRNGWNLQGLAQECFGQHFVAVRSDPPK